MNLFDYLNIGSDPRSAMMMGLAGGLLQGPTRPGRQTFGEAFGSGIQGAMQAQQAAQRQAMAQQELGMRREDLGMRRDEAGMRREQYEAQQEQARTAKERAAEIERRILEVDPSGRLLMAYRIDPKTVAKQLFPETGDPVVVQAGGALVDRAGKQLFRNPAEEKKPDFVRLMESAGIQPGTPQWNAALGNYIQKQSTHAPAASTSVYTGGAFQVETPNGPGFGVLNKNGGVSVLPGVTPPGTSAAASKPEQLGMLLDRAEEILQKGPTGSLAGKAVDIGAQVFGKATEGAKLAGQLKVIAGALVLQTPRMEGPQSNLDQQLYREATAQVGDDTLPPQIRLEAVRTARSIARKYSPSNKAGTAGLSTQQSSGAITQPSAGGARPITQSEYQALPRGATYVAPDGSTRIKQ